ncbi:hypothetical protein [Endozoicomonas sp. ALB115]|uniref:hypothetical protein n=1 Tax=Endozoicomonas sp. ALB115 TaxID=3403074 RepID=UPI003BB48EFE
MDWIRSNNKEREKLELIKHVIRRGEVSAIPWSRAAHLLDIDVKGLSKLAIKNRVKSTLTSALERYHKACEKRDVANRAKHCSSFTQIHTRAAEATQQVKVRLPKALNRAEEFSSNSSRSEFVLQPLQSNGITTQINADGENDNEITIGLDFGTSSIKAVVRDLSGNTFLVPFGNNNSTNKFLLPTRLYETDNIYSLHKGEQAHRDLKLALMLSSDDSSQEKATAFISLVLRYIRSWLFENYKSLYQSDYIIWGINLGLPAKSYDDKNMVSLFHKVGLAAANLSADESSEITPELVQRYLSWAKNEQKSLEEGSEPSDTPIMSDMVHVVPEIAAQVAGYIRSESWDAHHNMMMLVDIGAGTVDASVFTVTKPEEHQFAFLSSSVCPFGVMNLHRKRVDWLKSLIGSRKNADKLLPYLDEIYAPTDRVDAIPASWKSYIKGLYVSGKRSPDDEFYEAYRTQLYDDTICHGRESNPDSPEWTELPFFLCGGGSNMELYEQFIDLVNAGKSCSSLRLKPLRMNMPKGFEAKGLRDHDYHRFSVAYGLSYARDEIGRCIPEAEIPPLDRSLNRRAEIVSVSKDMI